MEKRKDMELIKTIVETYNVSEKDATLILKELRKCIYENSLENFIKEDLCVFKEDKDALYWFYENEPLITSGVLDIDITSDMVGKNLIDALLESNENYIKVNDNIHLTYWM